MIVQCQLFTQLRGQGLGATALARLGAAQAQNMTGRRRGAEIVVEADHPAHLGQAKVQGMSDFGDSRIGDVTDVVLDGMQDRQQGPGVALSRARMRWISGRWSNSSGIQRTSASRTLPE